MAAGNRVSVEFISKVGRVCKVVFYVLSTVVNADDPVVKGLIDLIERIIQAKAKATTIAISTEYAATPTNSAYGTVEDRMLLDIGDDATNSHNWKIPGPKTTDFLSTDKENVDFSNAAVAALVTAIQTYAFNQDGVTPMGSESLGHRIELKQLKR